MLVLERGREPGAGASGVAAGLLAPVTEADFGEGGRCASIWPAGRGGRGVCGGARRAHRTADWLPRQRGARRGRRPRRSRGLAPALRAPALARARRRVAAAVARPAPRAVPVAAARRRGARATGRPGRSRAVARALAAAVDELALGVEVAAIEHEAGRVTGVRTSASVVACNQVVIAAGAWSATLAPTGTAPPVRPVKGPDPGAAHPPRRARPHSRGSCAPPAATSSRTGAGRVALGATVEGRASTPRGDRGQRTAAAGGGLGGAPRGRRARAGRGAGGAATGSPDNTPLIGLGKPRRSRLGHRPLAQWRPACSAPGWPWPTCCAGGRRPPRSRRLTPRPFTGAYGASVPAPAAG